MEKLDAFEQKWKHSPRPNFKEWYFMEFKFVNKIKSLKTQNKEKDVHVKNGS